MLFWFPRKICCQRGGVGFEDGGGWEGGRDKTYRACISAMTLISFSTAAIFSAEVGWGRPRPRKDILGGGRGGWSVATCKMGKFWLIVLLLASLLLSFRLLFFCLRCRIWDPAAAVLLVMPRCREILGTACQEGNWADLIGWRPWDPSFGLIKSSGRSFELSAFLLVQLGQHLPEVQTTQQITVSMAFPVYSVLGTPMMNRITKNRCD